MSPEVPDQLAPPPSRAWRATRNAGFALVEFAWPAGLAFVITPLLVHGLGADAFGVLSIVGVTLGFFGLLDFGIGGAGTREIAQLLGRDDRRSAAAVFGTMATLYLVIGLVVVVVIGLAAPALVVGVLNVPPNLQDAAIAAFRISALGFPVVLLVSAEVAVLKAAQRFDLAARIALVFSTIAPFTALAAVQAGLGLVGIAIVSSIVNLGAARTYFVRVRQLLGDAPIPVRIDMQIIRRLFGFASWFLVASIGVTILYQLDKLLVGGLLGVAAVTYYVVPGGLANRIQGLLGAATAIVFPASADLIARGELEPLVRLYRDGNRLVFLLGATVAVPMAIFAEPFLRSWIGPDFADRSAVVMVLLVATYWLLGLTGVVWGLAFGAGQAKANALFVIGMGGLDVILFLLFVGPFGIVGAAGAYLISALLGVPLLIGYMERTVLGLPGWAYLTECARVTPAILGQAALALLLRPAATSLLVTVAAMVASAVVLPILYFGLRLATPADRALLDRVLSRVRRPAQRPG